MNRARSLPFPVSLGGETTATAEGRRFFQARLRLFAGWVFVLTSSFYLLNVVDAVVVGVERLLQAPNLWHLLACLTLGGVWLFTGWRERSAETLRRADLIGVTLTCLSFSAVGASLATDPRMLASDPVHAFLISQLACMSTILTRAVALPSTPQRTFWLGLAALLPQVLLAAYVFSRAATLPGIPMMAFTGELVVANLLSLVGWCAVALAISTVGSRIIFGLRVEADKIRRLGQYTLEEKIGEGGMGIVYRASHAMLRRPTAIKLLHPGKTGEDDLRRFEREVQLTATLSHPSTVAIFDYGRTPAGVFYYAMEYLDGLTLEQLVERDGPQDPGRVIHILRQVGGALTEAHENRLIHRDIKPANVILCERGGVPDVAKVVDFGLVKPVVSTESDATIMATGQHLLTGTPHYMAPEAIRGEQWVDGRSDIYSLGGVGVFLLTGQPVFTGHSPMDVVAHQLHTPPTPPSQRVNTVPPDLDTVLLRCLEKDPAARFATTRELVAALEACADRSPWSAEQAAEFWASSRRTEQALEVPVPRSSDGAPTLAIDFSDRLPDASRRAAGIRPGA